jgi:hypothetical protein
LVLDGGTALLTLFDPYILSWQKIGKILFVFTMEQISDTEGFFPFIDEVTKIRFTMEFDHLALYPGLSIFIIRLT